MCTQKMFASPVLGWKSIGFKGWQIINLSIVPTSWSNPCYGWPFQDRCWNAFGCMLAGIRKYHPVPVCVYGKEKSYIFYIYVAFY